MLDDEYELVMMVGMIFNRKGRKECGGMCKVGIEWRINVEMEQVVCCV